VTEIKQASCLELSLKK